MLEVQIAFVLLGIGLAGLCPFVVMQLRQLRSLESRLMASTYVYHSVGMATRTVQSNQIYYLVPWNNPWAQKLTTRAQLLPTPSNTSDPTVTSQPAVGFPHVTQPQTVSLTLDGNGNVTVVTAVVQVN
jgi:Tfp pilus assembly protein PilV